MFDKTQSKIIMATMSLIMEKGYSSTTTKDIAQKAGVNECTIFRKFDGKKDIVLSAMELSEWNPKLSEKDFVSVGNIEEDLFNFANVYMTKVTPQMVKVSIGLRTPELVGDTLDGIMKVPETFKKVLKKYFQGAYEAGVVKNCEAEHLAMMFLSMNFGFVFLDASFGRKLTSIDKEHYIKNSISVFINGIV